MIKKIKLAIAAALTFGLVAVPLAGATVMAQGATPQTIENGLCQGSELKFGDGTCAGSNIDASENSLNDLIADIINIVSVIVAIIAVIMIIIGGFKYITSGGDSGNVTGAKNTILYAVIGLVIVALAQFIVKFVLTQATGLTN